MLNYVFLRRSDLGDVEACKKIVAAQKLFPVEDVSHLIEKSIFSITAINSDETVVGLACFSDAPEHERGDRWEEDLSAARGRADAHASNTIFLRYFAAASEYADSVARETFRSLFVAMPELRHCFLCVPPTAVQAIIECALGQHFSPVELKSQEELPYSLLRCDGLQLYPHLSIRRARPEDYDDLMPMFNRQRVPLNKRFGDFFLNDLIEAQNENQRALVAQVEGKTVGFVSINAAPDISTLQNSFHLEAFNNLQIIELLDEKRDSLVGIRRTSTIIDGDELMRRTSKCPAVAIRVDDTRRESLVAKRMSLMPRGSIVRSGRLSVACEGMGGFSRESSVQQQNASERYELVDSAISINLFCIDEQYEPRSLDFVSEVFELFPDRDFCFLTLPHNEPEMLLLSNFTRIAPRPRMQPSHELYVMHRHSVKSIVTVHPLQNEDMITVERFLDPLPHSDLVMADVQRALVAGTDADGAALWAFTAQVQKDIIGVVVLRQAIDEEDQMRLHYNVEQYSWSPCYTAEEHALLQHCVISPVFDRHSKFILREVMRKAKVAAVYHQIYANGDTPPNKATTTLPAVLDHLLPVRRRRQIAYHLTRLQQNAPSEHTRELAAPYALMMINRKFLCEPKLTVNARLLVVGASDTGLAFLEALISESHLRLNNITLISPRGLKPSTSGLDSVHHFMSDRGTFSADDCKKISWSTWVNVVYGTVTELDRRSNSAILEDGSRLCYDYLILTPGLQYQAGSPGSDVRTEERVPNGLWAVNDASDAAGFISAARDVTDTNIVIYGKTLDVFSAIHGLLETGISGSLIHLVLPDNDISCFGSDDVKEHVMAMLAKNNVTIKSGLTLTGWRTTPNGGDLEAAVFTSNEETKTNSPVVIHCALLLNATEKAVGGDIFKAVNEACLVFDGRLVVDNRFVTNDPHILAAGSFTKYSRKFRQEEAFSDFSSVEVGRNLAKSLLRLIDPLVQLTETPGPQQIVASFTQPKTWIARLPGGGLFYRLVPPGIYVPPERTLLTLSQDKSRVFAMGLDAFSVVRHIVCYSSELQERELPNFSCLYGMHEKYLNNMVLRFESKLIPDFFLYFRETWSVALFHDRFPQLLNELTQLTASGKTGGDMAAFLQHVQKVAALTWLSKDTQHNLDKEIAEATNAALRSLDSPDLAVAIRQRLSAFLTLNDAHLPMYMRPGL